ncbi:sigma-70 family RNA polymerase sigma factor [Enterococcus saccharolyticus]|uniref:RNA polymerase sigma-70 region 2 domain-containing protein n=1 Tax=Candidatus Enterococcus willemsii TaxID=1857215 RepID=A0ABQ6YZM8_9ENTE|nr:MULTISPECIES: sigma-70 family RNA polymerase sigma factor [Enterococcus]KAF1304068.1 hypothetical protein BAU17_04030 [Enterococcus sp. CU12B]MCD5002071.1 sigma-70 family RNA polymerase sigma factor [Enterococcus saccharolyticus]
MQELLRAAKQGNEDALEQLFYRYRPLVYSIRNKYFLRDFDEQDWLQEGFITFHTCLQSFEEGFGITLGAFFKRSFENRIRSFVRKECAYKRKSNHGTVSLEQKAPDGSEYYHEPLSEETPLDHLLINENIEECYQLLSDLEKEALVWYVLGRKKPVHCSEQKMQSAYARSRRKITQQIQKK